MKHSKKVLLSCYCTGKLCDIDGLYVDLDLQKYRLQIQNTDPDCDLYREFHDDLFEK